MSMKKIGCSIITNILLFAPSILFSQSDYVINTKGDTIRGKISFSQYGKIDQAVVKGNQKATVPGTSIREIFLKDVRYKPVQFAGAIKFMQIKTEGYLSLLAFQPEGLMNYDGRLLQKKDGAILEVPSLGFKKQMSAFLKDHEKLEAQIKDGTLGRNDLDKIISEYNSFIIGKTTSAMTQNQLITKQKSKLDLLADLKNEIGSKEMGSKQTALDMLADIEGKIKSNSDIPSYLTNGLKEILKGNSDLLDKLETLLNAQP
jgi:hypothetical protein